MAATASIYGCNCLDIRLHLFILHLICSGCMLNVLLNSLQHTATHYTCCNTLQHSAARCNSAQATYRILFWALCNTLNTVQHEVGDRLGVILNIPQRTAMYCNVLQRTAGYISDGVLSTTFGSTQCNTLQQTVTHCDTLRYTATYSRRHIGRSSEQAGRCAVWVWSSR